MIYKARPLAIELLGFSLAKAKNEGYLLTRGRWMRCHEEDKASV